MGRLIINGEEIYELDEECLREKQKKDMEMRKERQGFRQQTQKERGHGANAPISLR